MEQGSTSLSASFSNENGDFALRRDHDVYRGCSSNYARKPSMASDKRFNGSLVSSLLEKLRELKLFPSGVSTLRSLEPQKFSKFICKFPADHLKRLIFEAIEQCEVKGVKEVRLSEEFFTSIWPIMVSAIDLLSFVYLYFKGYIDRGVSKARSSGSLDFRDIYISIVLFQAAYVWIKFRDVIPKGAIYRRPGSSKWEPRIKFPVMRGVGGRSKRIPLGSCNTSDEAEVAYQIAAFYCKKQKHIVRLDLGGGAYFPIPAWNVDPNLPYKEQVNQVSDQVLRVYAEFEEQKASRNVLPHVLGQALETSTGEGHLLGTSAIQQLRQPLYSGMDSTMQGEGSQLGPSTHNGVDFSNPDSLHLVLLKTQHELLETKKENESLKVQLSRMLETEKENESMKAHLSRMEVEDNKWKQRISELECENQRIMQLQPQFPPLDSEIDFDLDEFLIMGHEGSVAG